MTEPAPAAPAAHTAWYEHDDLMLGLGELLLSRERFDSGRPLREIDLAEVPSGPNVNAKNDHGQTALHAAALRGDFEEIVLLLKKGASATQVDKLRMTALHCCATHTHKRFDIVEKLLDAGASLNERDSFGRSAFSLFCFNPSVEVFQFLLKRRPALNSKDMQNWTPLHFACAGGSDHTVLERLLQSNDILSIDKAGRTPLHLASGQGHIDVVQYLLKAGAKINAKDTLGWTPLAMAIGGNHANLSSWIIENAKPDLYVKNAKGWTYLHLAASIGSLPTVQLLIDGAELDLDAVDLNGRTALHCAVVMQYTEIEKLLIAKGADVNIKDAQGWTAKDFQKSWWQSLWSCTIL